MVSEQILPASLEIYAKKPEYLAPISREFQQTVDEEIIREVIVIN